LPIVDCGGQSASSELAAHVCIIKAFDATAAAQQAVHRRQLLFCACLVLWSACLARSLCAVRFAYTPGQQTFLCCRHDTGMFPRAADQAGQLPILQRWCTCTNDCSPFLLKTSGTPACMTRSTCLLGACMQSCLLTAHAPSAWQTLTKCSATTYRLRSGRLLLRSDPGSTAEEFGLHPAAFVQRPPLRAWRRCSLSSWMPIATG
jgi:hypothetical protein